MEHLTPHKEAEKKGTFQLLGQRLIQIIIHKQDVMKIAPIKKGEASTIYLKNNVYYQVQATQEEIFRELAWGNTEAAHPA
ncbi:hypothetical protein CLV98_101761 [Dyadobacter jejuensis]|uniref:LytTr DNA-binding domain-containing protein n=1 Tax=Dyadobacter jejuensis TaxID=1082580 RepID=A0A316AT92_9BACT|nr:hypothetical protein [Dyadobacter jejuensis]PWJ60576.1 hypothetical protein CLV98_101761 [Dyadobacter jejuensis]